MELFILNNKFESVDVVDKYESLIWTDRYNECGDFEIYTTANSEMIALFQNDFYLWQENSEHQMIIEDVKIESDTETGNHLTITGNSLESILKRRIIWNQTTISGNLQNGIEKLLNDAIINPSDSNRKIENFIFKASEDERITSLTVDTQYTGDNLYDAIVDLCQNNNIGFKVILDEDQFIFSLYIGDDRSYDQEDNPYVVFSPNFENIINSNYKEVNSSYKNIALVAGEDQGYDRKKIAVGETTSSGLSRRELFVDARDISSTDGDTTISDSQYYSLLTQRGEEKLEDYKITKTFDGEVESTQLYRYGEHFFMGDICQLENEYGMESRVRVTEFIYSDDQNGSKTYPTFEVVDEDDEDET
jgi:hypothetical protein